MWPDHNWVMAKYVADSDITKGTRTDARTYTTGTWSKFAFGISTWASDGAEWVYHIGLKAGTYRVFLQRGKNATSYLVAGTISIDGVFIGDLPALGSSGTGENIEFNDVVVVADGMHTIEMTAVKGPSSSQSEFHLFYISFTRTGA